MSTTTSSAATHAYVGAAIVFLAPAVMMFGHAYHPWIGSPTDAGFFARLGAAVEADPTRWAVSHFTVAVGSLLLLLALLAIRTQLRHLGEQRWSPLAVPFIVGGCGLYAMLPAMEFAPLAAHASGGEPAAVQEAMMRWFVPIMLTSAFLFALGILGFALGIIRSRLLGFRLTWIVVGALAVLAVTRFLPVGAAQLYVGPAAAIVALWPIAYTLWTARDTAAHPVAAT